MELVNVPQYLSLVQMASQVHRSLTSPLAFKLKRAMEVYSGVKSLKDQCGANVH